MSQSFYLTENDEDFKKYKNAYVEYVVEFASKMRDDFGTSTQDSKIQKMAEKIYEFERQIAINMWSQTEMRDPANTQRKRILGQIATNDVVDDWSKFLNDFSARGANLTGENRFESSYFGPGVKLFKNIQRASLLRNLPLF